MLQVPKSPEYRTTIYNDLTGADFASDVTSVAATRSPDLLNMISDNGGSPVKRTGWEIFRRETSEILNLWTVKFKKRHVLAFVGGDRIIDVETGKTIFSDGNTYNNACTFSFFGRKSSGFFVFLSQTVSPYEYKRIVINEGAGGELFSSEPSDVPVTVSDFYIPTVREFSKPDGTGGQEAEAVNLFTDKVRFAFSVDPSNPAKKFVLSPNVDNTKPAQVAYNIDGNWHYWGSSEGTYMAEDGVLSYNLDAPANPRWLTEMENNFSIIVSLANQENKAAWVSHSTQALVSANSHASQVFLVGTNIYGVPLSRIYYSALDDPTYFPDTNYVDLNMWTEKVLMSLGSNVGVLSDDAVFILSPSTVTDTVIRPGGEQYTRQRHIYTVKRLQNKTHFVSSKTTSTLANDPLFLSQEGITALTTSNTEGFYAVQNRSGFLDSKLLEETDLEKAVGITWRNYYVLSVNNHGYILDGRKKAYDRKKNTPYLYEAYYWDNVPAKCMATDGTTLWFGTEDGRICRFKNTEGENAYLDGTVYGYETVRATPVGEELSSTWFATTPQTDKNYVLTADTQNYFRGDVFIWDGVFKKTGQAIHAVWSTPFDNDGKTNYYKTLMKKGTGCMLKGYPETSVTVYFQKDNDPKTYVGKFSSKGFSWTDIDFSHISFLPLSSLRFMFTHRKAKKYKRLKMFFENKEPFEGFGLLEAFKLFITTKVAKR